MQCVFLDEPHLQYDDVADVLRTAAEKKKWELLTYAKDKALERMLDECRKVVLRLLTKNPCPCTLSRHAVLFTRRTWRLSHRNVSKKQPVGTVTCRLT